MKLLFTILLLPCVCFSQWKIDNNKIITGSLVFVSGAAKGFNETLQFNYREFDAAFSANDQWFDPRKSWRNKYRNGLRADGEKFPLSSNVLVFLTDQYHLNNFIHRGTIIAALVVKIGGGKQKIIHYLLDAVYYTVCYQLGFSLMYYPYLSDRP